MINLPLIELDMKKKDEKYYLRYPSFTGEDNVYVLRLKPIDYNWANKVATIVWSARGSTEGYESAQITPVDGVVSMIVTSAWLSATTNQIQLNIYGTDGVLHEQSPIVEWYVRQSLPITDPAPERVDIIADLIAQTTAAVDSLESVETTCTESAEAAAQSAEDADDDAISAASALSQTLEAIGTTICPLGVDGKIPAANLPSLAINDTFTVVDTGAMLFLDAQRGDCAIIVPDDVVTDSYMLAGDDPAVLSNWKKLGVSYVAEAGHATSADTATNSDKVDGFHFVGITQAEYDAAVIETTNTIYVVTP